MNRTRTNLTLAALAFLLFFGQDLLAQSVAAKPGPTDSLLLTAEGKVEFAWAGATVWNRAQTNLVLHVGDRLRTGLRSRATVRLSNLTVLRVNELTTLQIQPPSEPGKQSMLDLKSGAAYFLSRERPTETEFRTPLASGAIRGTEFHIAVADDGTTEVMMIDGTVALSNELGAVDLVSGDQGKVEPGKAPAKTAVINAKSIIQWCLYYPAVLDPDELNLSADEKAALASSLEAYRSGDLLSALAEYPINRQPLSDAEKVYLAALLLSVGQVEKAETELDQVSDSGLTVALRELIAAVTQRAWKPMTPQSTSEWLAESYRLQSEFRLEEARSAVRSATEKSPNFGFAWARLAEMEFSFGRTAEALQALDKALQLSPRNAQALALKGFLLAAQNKIPQAERFFHEAIAVDGALGNAWLGRGLVRIRRGDSDAGLKDLQTAAVLEPSRAVLRSYLGKAFANSHDPSRASRELALAQRFDPNDPTAYLYSALLKQQENELNDAVRDLEKSQELNDNRRLYRSRLLLDQDRAVRSANLAAIYRDDGMTDWSVREASRAVSYDYANYSAHLFLSESYDALRDPKQINLRYETPWFSELLVAQLLAPVGAGNLSQYVSQQEYSKLFERDRFGLSSSTEYFSSGDWNERASQFGTLGNFSYAFDVEHRSENGQRPNNDLRQTTLYAKFKYQITPQDSLFLEVQGYDAEFGDVAQYYNQSGRVPNVRAPSRTFRGSERQEPNFFAGYHREWTPGLHTLLLTGRLDDTLSYHDANALIPFYRYTAFTREPFAITPLPFEVDYRREFEAYTAELQQIWQISWTGTLPVWLSDQTLVAGARYQIGWADTTSQVDYPFNVPSLISHQDFSTELERISFYAYDQWQPFDSLLLSAGVSYDHLSYPRNIDTSPITDDETSTEQVSPKAGIIWSPLPDTHLRGAYTRSLGGVFYDTSVRLEPTQIGGFNQAYRSIAPESAIGLVPGTEFETLGAAVDHSFKKTGTYFSVEGEILTSEARRTYGVVTNRAIGVPTDAASTRQSLDFEERSLAFTVNQLIGKEWSLGARYRVSEAELDGRFIDIPSTVAGVDNLNQNEEATLHQLNLFAIYNCPCGFFSRAEAIWSQQSNRGYTPDIPGDDFWQFNLYAGYRFWRRAAELRVGLLNITDQDYRLNPLNLYYELPRERTLSVSCKIYF